MATAADINAEIAANVGKPALVKTSTAETKQHTLTEQIAAAQHIAAQESAANGNRLFGLRATKARFGRVSGEASGDG